MLDKAAMSLLSVGVKLALIYQSIKGEEAVGWCRNGVLHAGFSRAETGRTF